MAPRTPPSQLSAVEWNNRSSRHVCLYGRTILGALADLKPSTTTTADIDRLRKKADQVVQLVETSFGIKLKSEAFAFIHLTPDSDDEKPALIICARDDTVATNDRATKEQAAAVIAKFIALHQFTKHNDGLKCVQVYSPGGYFGSVTVELAEIPSPVGRIAVAEKIATASGLGTPTQILPGMQDGKQMYHVKYRLSDLDSDDSANLCKKRLTSAAAQLKQGLRTTVYPRPHHRNVHFCNSKTLIKKGDTWDQAERFVRRNSVVEPSAGGSVAGPSAGRSVAGPPSARPSAQPSAGPSSRPAGPSAGPSARPSTAPTTTTLGFGSLAMDGDGNGHKGKGKGKERAEVEVGKKKQGRVREISENSLVKDLAPRKKRTVVFSLSPEPDIAPLAADSDPAAPALETPPPAALQQSTVVADAVAVAPVAAPVNAVAVESDSGTALKRLRAADAEFEEVQRRRKAALEDLLRIQEAEAAKTRERLYGL